MRIRMVKNAFDFELLNKIGTLEIGKVYNLPDDIALHFIKIGYAIEDKVIGQLEVKWHGTKTHNSTRYSSR